MASFAAVRQTILARFPQQFSFCFSYGSGVKQQLGYSDVVNKKQKQQHNRNSVAVAAAPLIDLVLCVDDAAKWHEENLRLNPGDYSSLARLAGSGRIASLQTGYGARVYCNTLIPLPSGDRIKYGVISTQHLVDDLNNWRYLYVAGRLHKPVEVLQGPATKDIDDALVSNRRSAVHAALLRLPETFTMFDLFYAVANLSYAGDFRMYFGEKKDKVRNIVTPQLDEFYDCYQPILDSLQNDGLLSLPVGDRRKEGLFCQDTSPDGIYKHLLMLPANVKRNLVGSETDMAALAKHPAMGQRLAQCLERIVFNSSVVQSLKNIPTAGLAKAWRYSWQKVLKTFNM